VYDRVAQHMLERRQHALQDLAIELARGALHYQVSTLAGIVRGLANDTRETLDMALEGHHACTPQAVLQLGDGTSLLLQQILGFLAEILEELLNAADVVGRFGERPGVMLNR